MIVEVVLSLLAILAARIVWRRWRYDLHKMPSPPELPLVGHTLNLLRPGGEAELSRFVGTSWKALGEPDVMRLEIGGRTTIFVWNLEYIRNVVMSKTYPFPKNRTAKRFMTPVRRAPTRLLHRIFSVLQMVGNDMTVDGMISTPGSTPYVKAIRRVYATGLQSSSLKRAMPKLHKVLDRMIGVLERSRQEGPVDFQELCVRMTLDTIGVVAFDTELGGLDKSRQINEHLLEAGHISFQRGFQRIRTFLHKQLPFLEGAKAEESKLDALTREWDALTRDILVRDDPPSGEDSLWFNLRSVVDPETGSQLEYKRLRTEVATVVLTGMDTTGHQLAYILALLASHPNVVERLIAELKEHGLFGPERRQLTFEDLAELSYLQAIVKEGLRISHVIASSFGREVPEDTEILGYRVPRGVNVAIVGSRGANSETEWREPDAFKPERWLTEEDMSQKYYLPFSIGPRDCVGQRLAMLELRMAIARLVQHYILTPTRPAEEMLKDSRNGLVIESIKGVWIRVTPREWDVHQ